VHNYHENYTKSNLEDAQVELRGKEVEIELLKKEISKLTGQNQQSPKSK